MQVCWKCGKVNNNDDRKTCSYCGADLKDIQFRSIEQQDEFRKSIRKERCAVIVLLAVLVFLGIRWAAGGEENDSYAPDTYIETDNGYYDLSDIIDKEKKKNILG